MCRFMIWYDLPAAFVFLQNQINSAGWSAKSLPRIGKQNTSHSRSFPRVSSSFGRSLPSVKSESASTIRRKFEIQEKKAPPQDSSSKDKQMKDESSDESGAEEEHIIRIDSPSRLSFR